MIRAIAALVIVVSSACAASFAADGMWGEALACVGFTCFGAAGFGGRR